MRWQNSPRLVRLNYSDKHEMKKRQFAGTGVLPDVPENGATQPPFSRALRDDAESGGEHSLGAGHNSAANFHAQKYIRFIYQINYIIWIKRFCKSKRRISGFKPLNAGREFRRGTQALRMRSWTDIMS